MARITYVTHDGKEQVVDVPSGYSVMEGAVKNGVPGIDADCGGAGACATCRADVDEAWLAKLAPASEPEKAMLDFLEDVRPNSRLTCQIKVDDALDGLRVVTPDQQN